MTQPLEYRPSRAATRLAATLSADGEVVPTMLCDISRDGARVSMGIPLLRGTAVRLKVGRADVPALVHWWREGQAGLRFLARLDAETLTMIERARPDD